MLFAPLCDFFYLDDIPCWMREGDEEREPTVTLYCEGDITLTRTDLLKLRVTLDRWDYVRRNAGLGI